MDILGNLAIGLETALAPENLIYCFLGVVLGKVVGILPGIGALVALTLLLPITFHLGDTSSIVMLGGVYYGATYGGSIASILLNLPGTTTTAITCLDGYPMAKQGRAGVALLMTSLSSFSGASIGILITMALAPIISAWALRFGPADYFSIMALGLVAATSVGIGSPVKSLTAVVIGLLAGTVGTDIETGAYRFTFDMTSLADGVPLVALAMGLFGVAEVIFSVRGKRLDLSRMEKLTFRNMLPTRWEVRRAIPAFLRGSALGSFFGALPGTGSSIASFIAYAVEKRVSKNPERFGQGAIEGLVAPESANNSADQTAFIPTLTLGIPGNVVMALIIGALTIHGITPGPTIMTTRPDLFWGVIMSFWVGNLILLAISVPLIGVWVRILYIPYNLLFPAVLMFVSIGAYSVSNNAMHVIFVAGFGLLGYLMRLAAVPAAPLLLGFVLGPLMEENFRRAMLMSRGDAMTFITSPISAAFLAICVLLIAYTSISGIKTYRNIAKERQHL